MALMGIRSLELCSEQPAQLYEVVLREAVGQRWGVFLPAWVRMCSHGMGVVRRVVRAP